MTELARLQADRGEKERAVELYALASRNPYVGNCRWFEDVAGNQIAAIAATLPPAVVTAAQVRGKTREWRATAKELLEELEGELSVSASDTTSAQQEPVLTEKEDNNTSPSNRLI